MEITYRAARPSDAAQLLSFLKAVGGESDNLSFGADGVPFSAEQEERFLENQSKDSRSVMLLALDGDTIVANGCIEGYKNLRFRHRCNLSVAVRKSYWGNGVGSGLMQRLIAFAKDSELTAKVNEIIEELKADGTLASLAEKYGVVLAG